MSPAAGAAAARATNTGSGVDPAVARLADPAAEAAIGAACRALHLPTVRAEAGRIAEAAARERLSHRAFLAEVLCAECDARRRVRRVQEAKFPRIKRLADFDLAALPSLPPATLAMLAAGGWIDAGEPVVLLGDSGTGKTHLLIGLGIAAAEAGRRVRYTSTAALVNELAEAADDRQLGRVLGRYARVELLCLDEVGYVHLDPRGAELLFQIITDREERASIACASNAPFSEWGQTFTDPRLAAAVVDRPHLPRPHHQHRHRVLPAAQLPGRQDRPAGPGHERPTAMIERSAPRTDEDTFDVLDDALAALAERKALWLGDDLVLIHLLASLIAQAERCLPEAVLGARDNGASWDDIAALLGTSPHEASLRFAPDSPIADGRWPIPPTD